MAFDLDADLATMFDTDEFGAAASWFFQRTGATSTVNGHFSERSTEVDGENSSIITDRPEFLCRSVDVADGREDDEVTIGGVLYLVNVIRPDGLGMSTVELRDG